MAEFVTKVRFVHDFTEQDLYDHNQHRYETFKCRRTLAMVVDDADYLHVAEAVCSPWDQFSRKSGRIKSEARLRGKAQHHYDAYPLDDQNFFRHYVDTSLTEEGKTYAVLFCLKLLKGDLERDRNRVAEGT